jgi:hypothetical protein
MAIKLQYTIGINYSMYSTFGVQLNYYIITYYSRGGVLKNMPC